MAGNVPDHRVINKISLITMFFRVMTILLIVVLGSDEGFTWSESRMLIIMLLPLTVTYLSAFIRHIIRNPYTIEVKTLTRTGAWLGLSIPIITGFIYIVMIITNAYYKQSLPTELLENVIVAGEVLNAIYAGTYLSGLLELREQKQA